MRTRLFIALLLLSTVGLAEPADPQEKHDLFGAKPTVAYQGYRVLEGCAATLAFLRSPKVKGTALTVALGIAALYGTGKFFATRYGQSLRSVLPATPENIDYLLEGTDDWLGGPANHDKLRRYLSEDEQGALKENLLARLRANKGVAQRIQDLKYVYEFGPTKDPELEDALLERMGRGLDEGNLGEPEAEALCDALWRVGTVRATRAILLDFGRPQTLAKQANLRLYCNRCLSDQDLRDLLRLPFDEASEAAVENIGVWYDADRYAIQLNALLELQRGNPYAIKVLQVVGVPDERLGALYEASKFLSAPEVPPHSHVGKILRTSARALALADWKENTPKSRARAIAYFRAVPDLTPPDLSPAERDKKEEQP